jgi:hypothetical protein
MRDELMRIEDAYKEKRYLLEKADQEITNMEAPYISEEEKFPQRIDTLTLKPNSVAQKGLEKASSEEGVD